MENTNKATSKDTKKVSSKKTPRQISIFTVILILCVIAASIGIYFGVRALIITLKYKQYTDKMEVYGFNELYNNDKATSIQELTNAELLKVAIGSINNIKDISQAYYLADESVSEDKNWYNYSNYLGVNNVVTEKELDVYATKSDAILLVARALESFLGNKVEKAKLNIAESKLKKYTTVEQEIIAKAVTLGIMKNKSSALSNGKIIKGELNKIIIEAVEKYGIIYYGNTNIKDNEKVTIVTEKDKMPDNYKEYPYIVSNISKDMYEVEYKIRTNSTFKDPKETYKIMGYLYGQTDELLVRYFKNILNVDYATITEQSFLEGIGRIVAYKISEEDVSAYVKYVKDNKIKLEGKATPLLPIMYNNGEEYVVRTKITFTVISSDTQYNLLFGDEANKIKYNGTEITMYVDMPTGMTFNSNSLLVKINCLATNIIKPTSAVVVEE